VIFYLGTHQPHWLATCDFPLFVSRVRLAGRRTLPRARSTWALDSGGFSALDRRGEWDITARQYVAEVRRYRDEIGNLVWAAPMDWMVEPWILAKTGLSVPEHQRRTVDNFLELRSLAADLPFTPVLQGWALDDYLHCVDLYQRADVDLTVQQVVGLGSVCRRQATAEIGAIVGTLAALHLPLHGFGVKIAGLASYSAYLTSADSMAWSAWGRRTRPCVHGRANSEANCRWFAGAWRDKVLAAVDGPAQLDLFAEVPR